MNFSIMTGGDSTSVTSGSRIFDVQNTGSEIHPVGDAGVSSGFFIRKKHYFLHCNLKDGY